MSIGLAAVIERRPIRLLGRPWLILLGLIFLWGALSSLWSVNPKNSLLTALQLLTLFTCGLVVLGGVALLNGREAERICRWLTIGMIAALIVYAIEITLNSPIQSLIRPPQQGLEAIYSPFNRGLAVLVLLLVPTALALRRIGYWHYAVGLIGATTVIIYAYYGSSMAVGLTIGIIAGTLSFFGRQLMVRLIGWLVAAMILIAPFATREIITPALLDAVGKEVSNVSVLHRLVIWQFVSTKAIEKPLTGWGLDSARTFPDGKTKVSLSTAGCQDPCSISGELLPLHAHNIALQWWLELGLTGAALGALLILYLCKRVTQMAGDRIEQALLMGQLTAALAIAGLSYGAWQSWWLSTLLLAVVFSTTAMAACQARDLTLPLKNASQG